MKRRRTLERVALAVLVVWTDPEAFGIDPTALVHASGTTYVMLALLVFGGVLDRDDVASALRKVADRVAPREPKSEPSPPAFDDAQRARLQNAGLDPDTVEQALRCN